MDTNLNRQNKLESACLTNVISGISKNVFFGLSDDEITFFKSSLFDAKLNEKGTKFPDFFIPSGFIEHFEITSSFQGKKGSKQKVSSIQFENKSKNKLKKYVENNTEETQPRPLTFSQPFEKHSQENIRNSIKRNWRKHIESLKKYDGEKDNSIFLMYYSDVGMLQTAENFEDKPSEVYDSYRITLDRYVLEWLYQFNEEVQYLILLNAESLEILKISSIPSLLEKEIDSIVAPTFGIETHSFYPLFTID